MTFPGWQATPSFAPTSLAPEPPNLASQLNALLTRRGGPVEVAAGDGDGIFVGFYRDLMFFKWNLMGFYRILWGFCDFVGFSRNLIGIEW